MDSKHTKPVTLFALAGGKGGGGKTFAGAMLIANTLERLKLRRPEIRLAYIDCDQENADTELTFSHWLEGNVNSLNLRDPEERDRLLTDTRECAADFVVADLPGNSSGDLTRWLTELVTVKLLQKMNIRLVVVCMVQRGDGGARSAVKWIKEIGSRAHYIVMLNRSSYEYAPKPSAEVFMNWYEGAVPEIIQCVTDNKRPHVIDVGFLEDMCKVPLIRAKKLPYKVETEESLHDLNLSRLFRWTQPVYEQLVSTGLFE